MNGFSPHISRTTQAKDKASYVLAGLLAVFLPSSAFGLGCMLVRAYGLARF